jgi:hypothetical protein
MINKGNKDYSKRTQKDYSLAFRLQVVDEVEKGLLSYKQSAHEKESSTKNLHIPIRSKN